MLLPKDIVIINEILKSGVSFSNLAKLLNIDHKKLKLALKRKGFAITYNIIANDVFCNYKRRKQYNINSFIKSEAVQELIEDTNNAQFRSIASNILGNMPISLRKQTSIDIMNAKNKQRKGV